MKLKLKELNPTEKIHSEGLNGGGQMVQNLDNL